RPFDSGAPTSFSRSITVEQGAQVLAPPGSTLALSAASSIFFDGTFSAPGGSISLVSGNNAGAVKQEVFPPGVTPDVRRGWHAQLLVPGYQRTTLEAGLPRRRVFGAGSISVQTPGAVGSVLIDSGALLDASGIQAIADVPSGPDLGGGRYSAVQVD